MAALSGGPAPTKGLAQTKKLAPISGLALKFHACILPILLIVVGCYTLLIRAGVTCTASGVPSRVLEKTCRDGPLYAVNSCRDVKTCRDGPLYAVNRFSHLDDGPHPGVRTASEEQPLDKMAWQASFELMALTLLVWAWIFYSLGQRWKLVEANFLGSLQEDQAITQELIAKCRLFLMKYLSVHIVSILQLLVFLITTSVAATGEGFSTSTWMAIARGQHVLPRTAKCIFHKYGPSGTVQLHDAMCHLDFNQQIENIYLFCVVFAIIALVHMVADVFYCITVSNVKILQGVHLCIYGPYTWAEARECLGLVEPFSGRWMLHHKFTPTGPAASGDSLLEMQQKTDVCQETFSSFGQYNRM